MLQPRLRRAVSGAVIAGGLALAALMLAPALLGYHRYVITGDSMSGSYDRGSLVFADEVPAAELEVGDVITYEPPPGIADLGLVTHRVVSIREGGERPILRTRGDANAAGDPWTFTPSGSTMPRAAFGIPYVGYALAALSIRELRMLLIGGPAALIALALLLRLWRETGEGASERREADPAESLGEIP